jgi:Flp pilus assembly protein TadB
VGRGDTPGDTPTDALLSEMQDRIADPRDQLAAERRANEENPRIIAALTARITATEAPRESPSEPPESPTAATEQPGRERAAGAGRRPAASRRAPVLVAEDVWGVRWSVAAALVAIAAVLLGVLVA